MLLSALPWTERTDASGLDLAALDFFFLFLGALLTCRDIIVSFGLGHPPLSR